MNRNLTVGKPLLEAELAAELVAWPEQRIEQEPEPGPMPPVMAHCSVAFVGLVDSTSLLAHCEVDAFWTFTDVHAALREQTVRHDGRVIEEAGDGVLLAFGSPISADWCALACHWAVARINPRGAASHRALRLRIGIDTGQVFLSGRRLFGRVVTNACLLQQAATPGATLVSEAMHEALTGTGFPLAKVEAPLGRALSRAAFTVARTFEPVLT